MKSLLFQGQKLKQARESKGYTMQEMEELTGIKAGAQSEIERGVNKNPRPATVDKLCKALDKDPIYFYYNGENLIGLFPDEIPQDVREFVFNIENLPYMQLAMKLKDPEVSLQSLENVLEAYIKAVKMNKQ